MFTFPAIFLFFLECSRHTSEQCTIIHDGMSSDHNFTKKDSLKIRGMKRYSFHLIDVIDKEILNANVKNACFIMPTYDIVTHDHNLHKGIINLCERINLL